METTLSVPGLEPATKYTFRARCGKLLAGSTGLEEGMEDSVIVSHGHTMLDLVPVLTYTP